MSSQNSLDFSFRVHGLSTGNPLRMSVHCADPVVRDQVMFASLRNAYYYLTSKLALLSDHIYLRASDNSRNHFFKMQELDYEWAEIRKYTGHCFAIIYSETDLRFHSQAQQFLRRSSFSQLDNGEPPTFVHKRTFGRSNSVLSTKLERQESVKNSVLIVKAEEGSEDSTKSIEKRKEYLTRHVGTSPRVSVKTHPRILANASEKAPFSFLKQVGPDTVLYSPVYLSDDELVSWFNQGQHRSLADNIWTNYTLNSAGELVLSNQTVIEAEKGVLKEVIGNRLSSIFGREANQGLPIRIFKPYSQLEAIANLFCNFSLLHQAAKTSDALRRFQCVIAYGFGSVAYGINPWKPFTPYLGETLQAKTADGSEIFLEHYGHKPFIDSILIVNKEAGFTVSATFEVDSDESANAVVVHFKGLVSVSLGRERYFYNLPSINNEGFSYNKRTLNLVDNMVFYAPTSGLKALVRFGAGSRPNDVAGGVFTVLQALPVTAKTMEKTLFRNGKPELRESTVSQISGCWFDRIAFDSVALWEASKPAYKLLMKKDPLPSDWRFREDILWLLYQNPEFALAWKLKLEETQREFRGRRAKFLEKHKWLQYK